ncbi:hypothetical protein D7I41_01540 [Ochrobactrum sp. MH181795]|jgi:hypothetical protein|nr:hypothetical protein CQ057_20885 [Ochrobactrum sp. MYb49]RNL47714.1 hypothetical protein D7I41_01540 [Ochrobactrum sp. MH181795]
MATDMAIATDARNFFTGVSSLGILWSPALDGSDNTIVATLTHLRNGECVGVFLHARLPGRAKIQSGFPPV